MSKNEKKSIWQQQFKIILNKKKQQGEATMKVIININDSDIMGTLTLLRLASKEYADPELDKTAEQCKGKTFEMTPEDFGEESTALKVALCALCLGKCHESEESEGNG